MPGIAAGERPLTADGEAEFRSAAGGLAWIGDPPDVLLSSPLVRARATADIAARTFGRLEPRIEPALAADGAAETVLSVLAAHEATATTVGVVGHEPLLSVVLARLLRAGDNRLEFDKGGAALGRIRERTLIGALGAASVRARRERTTLRRLLLAALRDYAAETWTPRRAARAPEVV